MKKQRIRGNGKGNLNEFGIRPNSFRQIPIAVIDKYGLGMEQMGSC
jgi:hypothetical protein